MKNLSKATTTGRNSTKRPVIRLYNTLTRKIEPLKPLHPAEVLFYTCGLTVYNFGHIGNFRTFIHQDVLRRVLEHAGYRVQHVMNVTDVDDKTIKGAQESGQSLESFTRRYTRAFFEDTKKLNILPASTVTYATKYIPQMVVMIKKLIEKGVAYEKDGSVYFSIDKFPSYGKLSHLDKKSLKVGARVEADEYLKENPSDFALWKAWTPADGEVFWETELGKGRPGWHIECSAMSTNELGQTIDIHSGGSDLIFPHHENEIAQSEAATGKPFAQYWIHTEHLLVNGEKMSKSKGNQYTIRDIEQRGYDPIAFRYLVLQSNYRSQMDFTWDALDAAQKTLSNIRELEYRGSRSIGKSAIRSVEDALYDDLDSPKALAILHNDQNWAGWLYFDNVLGLGLSIKAVALAKNIQSLINEREKARKAGDFPKSDRIRQELAEEGIIVEDTPKGPRVIQKSVKR